MVVFISFPLLLRTNERTATWNEILWPALCHNCLWQNTARQRAALDTGTRTWQHSPKHEELTDTFTSSCKGRKCSRYGVILSAPPTVCLTRESATTELGCSSEWAEIPPSATKNETRGFARAEFERFRDVHDLVSPQPRLDAYAIGH